MWRLIGLTVMSLLAWTARPLAAQEAVQSAQAAGVEKTVEELVEATRKSVVVITFTGRDGGREGLGTGFVLSGDGLIATNLHVIGEARPISVQTSEGRRYPVSSVHASDRANDLAIIRVEAKGLAPLKLADSDELKQGQAVVAIGNPLGLNHSVVTGVVSGRREMEGRDWIQLAIPIEPGNSGGPLLDMQGRVHGLLTMKSLLTANMGFAVPINRLKPLLEKPNPITLENWLTIGKLDPAEWTPVFGARWRRSSGRIAVEGIGEGFAGRALCLSRQAVPEIPYEVAVTVKLHDESGAAGLAFAADGGDRHWGFYPTAGKMRLTQFDGPDVTSWNVLYDQASPHYRSGDFNTIKVRVEAEKVVCYLNGQPVCEVAASAHGGQAGLAKFRATEAEFKQFRLGKELASLSPPKELVERVNQRVEGLVVDTAPEPDLVESLAGEDAAVITVLRDRARLLEREALQLGRLARAVHHRRVLAELAKVVEAEEEQIDLFHAALLIARLDNDELEVEAYRKDLEQMAGELAARIGEEADDARRLEALNEYLFGVRGFHGSRADYYNRSNSYINEVLDDREGLPITLSIVYMELAARVGMTIEGVGLPGHFIVRHVRQEEAARADVEDADGENVAATLIDVYERGERMSPEQVGVKVQEFAGRSVLPADLEKVGKRAILVRMLHNLRGIAGREQDLAAILRYLDAILVIDPHLAEDRWFRAVGRFQAGQGAQALADLDWLAEHAADRIDGEQAAELRRLIEQASPQNR